MSLIKDVRDEIKILPLDNKSLHKFGLLIGGIFLAIAIFLLFSEIEGLFFWIFLITGLGLFIFGFAAPKLLRTVYVWWMTGAIVIGWFVSRIILILLFFLVITPIGLIAKIVGKKFLDIKFRDKRESYWIIRTDYNKKINYSKMY